MSKVKTLVDDLNSSKCRVKALEDALDSAKSTVKDLEDEVKARKRSEAAMRARLRMQQQQPFQVEGGRIYVVDGVVVAAI